MMKMQEKSKIYNIHDKVPTPPQTKANYKLPSNQAMWMSNTKFQTQEGSKKSTRFVNGKDHTPLNQGKSNQASNSTKDANSP
jgi:hypothetical protein